MAEQDDDDMFADLKQEGPSTVLDDMMNATKILQRGGRMLQVEGLPLHIAFITTDWDWLSKVTKVTFDSSVGTKFWADTTELAKPSGLIAIGIVGDDLAKAVAEQGAKS